MIQEELSKKQKLYNNLILISIIILIIGGLIELIAPIHKDGLSLLDKKYYETFTYSINVLVSVIIYNILSIQFLLMFIFNKKIFFNLKYEIICCSLIFINMVVIFVFLYLLDYKD